MAHKNTITADEGTDAELTALEALDAVDDRLRVGTHPGARLETSERDLDVQVGAVQTVSETDLPEMGAALEAAGIVRWARYEAEEQALTGALGEDEAGDVYHLLLRDGEILKESAELTSTAIEKERERRETDGGWITGAETEWCQQCQRERISCAHMESDEEIVTDGGVEYTALEVWTEELCGELGLDVIADEDRGVGVLKASTSALKDNAQRLEDDGYDTDLLLDEEPPRLLIHPRSGDLVDGTRRYVTVDPADLERGDRVLVQDVADDLEVEGDVTGTMNEAGRIGVAVEEDDGTESVVWENTGRTYTRIEE